MREILGVFYTYPGEITQKIDSFWDNFKDCNNYCQGIYKALEIEYKDKMEQCPIIEVKTFLLNGNDTDIVWKKFIPDFPDKFDFSNGSVKIMVKDKLGNIDKVELVRDEDKNGGTINMAERLDKTDMDSWLYVHV